MITDGSWAFRTPHKRILYTFKFRFQPKPIIPYGIKLKRVKLNSKKKDAGTTKNIINELKFVF